MRLLTSPLQENARPRAWPVENSENAGEQIAIHSTLIAVRVSRLSHEALLLQPLPLGEQVRKPQFLPSAYSRFIDAHSTHSHVPADLKQLRQM